MSSEKAARVAERRRMLNSSLRSAARTYVSRARRLIEAKELASAETTVQRAIVALDKASQKGVIHSNNASRRKSRLMKQLNAAKAETSKQP